MSRFVIHIPVIDAKKTVEVDVKVNGERQRVQYRVELFDWPETDGPTERIERLRSIISSYEDGWDLFQIGPATGDGQIPIIFKQGRLPPVA